MISISPAALNLTQEEWTILEQLAVANNTSKEELISTAVKKFITLPYEARFFDGSSSINSSINL